ncbi:MAG: ABC transporter ATP-binding protein [candidate division WOR-3 bacterium]
MYAGYKDPPVLRGVSFYLKKGEILSILGKNGTGKTTLLRVLSGILKPLKGEINFDGKNIFKMDPFERAKKISYLPQFYESDVPFTVYEMVELGFYPYTKVDKEKLDYFLRIFDIYELKNKKFSELSGGQKQKVLLARSLVKDPELILLDEPSLHLDFENTFLIFDIMKNILKRENKNLIFVIHDINIAIKFSDYFLFLKENGNTLFVEKNKIFEKKEIISEYLGFNVKIFNLEGENFIFYR